MSVRTLRIGLNLYRKCSVISQSRTLHTVSMANHKGTYPSIQQLTAELADIMGIEKGYKPIPKSRDHLQQLIPVNQTDLPPRTMKDSFTVGVIPLGSDTILQEKYVSITGQVRVSRFLEDMDIFAVVVVQRYMLNPNVKPGMHSPYTIVTALVDRIEFTGYIPKLTEDVRISGHVSWVGKTSVEVIVWLDQDSHGEWRRLTKAAFLLAIRDAINSRGAVVNPLVTENEQEKNIVAGGQFRKLHRMEMQKFNLARTLPTYEEQKLIHDMFTTSVVRNEISLKKKQLPTGCKWMDELVLSNIIHSHPQNRNLHDTVFGGFLMRQAAELSYTLGLLFAKFKPFLKSISDITFYNPVRITVYAETWETTKEQHITTNAFHFTYEVPEMLPEVYPKTYDEAMMYIDARRHYALIMNDNEEKLSFEPITTFEMPKNNSLRPS